MIYKVTTSRRIVVTVLLVVNILAVLWAMIADRELFPVALIPLPLVIVAYVLLWWPISTQSKTAWIWWKGQ